MPTSSAGSTTPPTPSFVTASELITADCEDATIATTTPQTTPPQYTLDVPSHQKQHEKPDICTVPPRLSGADMAFRSVKQLPRELRDHCKIFLEEQMYLPAIELLDSLLTAQGHLPPSQQRPVYIPPQTHVAFLASLAIHPKYTNRTTDSDGKLVGTHAIKYLRTLLRTVGPVNANLAATFDFEQWLRHNRRGDDDSEDEDALNSAFANSQIVFGKAGSFWKVLGWAFNCSALHPERWRHWHGWIRLMVDVLVGDYRERERLDSEAPEDAADSRQWRRGSLILRYAGDITRHDYKRMLKGIMRAILADGSESSLREFPELYKDETLPPVKPGSKRKRDLVGSIDLDNVNFGDWLDDDDGFGSEGPAPESPTRPARSRRGRGAAEAVAEAPPPSEDLLDSMDLRLRLWDLLGDIVTDFSTDPDGLRDFYIEFCTQLRSLHPQLFHAFIAPESSGLQPDALVTVLRESIQMLQPNSAPKAMRVDRKVAEAGSVNAKIMEKCYLPFVAPGGIENNAKYSLLAEALLRILWQYDSLAWSEGLDAAVREGVALRDERARPKRGSAAGRTKEAREEAARAALAESGQRLELLMDIVRNEEVEEGDGQQGT